MHPTNKARNSFMNKALITSTALRKITQGKLNEKGKRELQENFTSPSPIRDGRVINNVDVRDQSETLITQHKAKIASGYNQCFDGGNFTPQYEEECPVNYSLKYSETESCKGVTKNENSKEKFKDFADYTETDLDQPTNFSLKYAENNCCDEETKNSNFNYFENEKGNFKRYVDYAETDLDQPTDFTLKYRESVDEDGKIMGFNYYGSDKNKSSNCQETHAEVEDTTNDRMDEHFACEDETPLMFSRCSSMNSLSSFVHITQSIPDDRSSIVSDFSRMTSGIISPSELPDSPTQTAPSSPKRIKSSICFPAKSDFLQKKSVFEDDVATYKLEDTPVEFSRATSLSSLNIENTSKTEFLLKSNIVAVPPGKEEPHNSGEQIRTLQIKNSLYNEKPEQGKEKLELTSASEVDNLLAARVSAEIKKKCSKPRPGCNRLPEKSIYIVTNQDPRGRTRHPDFLKPNPGVKFLSEPSKIFSSFEVSEDAVHTYCMEGTPANVSHAGSHSDLSTLSMASGIQPLVADNLDAASFSSEETENIENLKAKNCKSTILDENSLMRVTINKKLTSDPKGINVVANRISCISNQPRFDYLRKDTPLTAKDETATFATESSPCDFSIRSSLSDLTVNVGDSPLCLNRNDNCEEQSSQTLSPLHNVSPQSPSSVTLGDLEDSDKVSEEEKLINEKNDYYEEKSPKCLSSAVGNSEKNLKETEGIISCSQKPASPKVQSFDFYSSEPLTPFEEALLEQCILLGMPQRNISKKVDEYKMKSVLEEKSKPCKTKEQHSNTDTNDNEAPECERVEPVGSSENFDLDSSEPLSSFEEALLEQCIRLGMPEKKNVVKDETALKPSDEGGENLNSESPFNITPLEAVLLEQCIRLGMPQKKNSKKNEENNAKSLDPYDETNKIISCVTAQLSKLKMSSEAEKDSLKKNEYTVCICGRRHHPRRKNHNCKKSKKCKD